eukprot:10898676-Lingulodinium_polyedra.AAC.1
MVAGPAGPVGADRRVFALGGGRGAAVHAGPAAPADSGSRQSCCARDSGRARARRAAAPPTSSAGRPSVSYGQQPSEQHAGAVLPRRVR